jgi:hypothetical protein
MHYKNGKPASEGDKVVFRDYTNKVTVGTVFNLRPGVTTCNCDVAVIAPGTVQLLTCQTVGTMYHAEDAFNSLEPREMPAAK